ncbi:MAG: LamG domain-containing protein, partial [Actinomycetota bacterium]
MTLRARALLRVGALAVLFGVAAIDGIQAAPAVPQASTGPVGYWPLDETDVNSLSVFDATSNGNNGTRTPTNGGTDTPAQISTDVAPVPGPANLRSLLCNADTDRPEGALISDGAGASLNISGPLTLSVWVKIAGSGPTRTDNMGVVERLQNPGSGYSGYFLRLYRRDVGGGVFEYVPAFTTSNAGSHTSVGAANSDFVARGVWTHLAAVYDGTNLHLYKNGTSVASNPGSAPGAIATTLSIGNDKGDNRFHGNVDEVRVFNRALTQSEIGVLINGQPAPTNLNV